MQIIWLQTYLLKKTSIIDSFISLIMFLFKNNKLLDGECFSWFDISGDFFLTFISCFEELGDWGKHIIFNLFQIIEGSYLKFPMLRIITMDLG